MESAEQAQIDAIESAFQSLTLHSSQDISRASNAIEVLAQASRWDAATREQLAEPGILRILVDVVDCSIHDALETAELALRCIGNACIDNNAASAEVTTLGFAWAKQCLPVYNSGEDESQGMMELNDPAISILTAKVLYNICSDYEPAQQACFQEHIYYTLIELCTTKEVVESDDKPLFIELLFWICSHMQPDQDAPPANVIAKLLALPELFKGELEPEDFALLTETCLLFLREPEVKRNIIDRSLVSSVWRMLELNEDLLASLQENEADRRLLPPLTTALIWVLSDMAASPDFAAKYDLNNPWISTVVLTAIKPVHRGEQGARVVDAACQILGNLLWSTEGNAVHDNGGVADLYQPAILILETSEDIELLHSAAGLLVQLARLYPRVRENIGADENSRNAIGKLCGHNMPQLKQDGITLLRVLGKGSPENQQRFAELARMTLNSATTNDAAMIEV